MGSVGRFTLTSKQVSNVVNKIEKLASKDKLSAKEEKELNENLSAANRGLQAYDMSEKDRQRLLDVLREYGR